MMKIFKMKVLRELQFSLGFEVDRNKDRLTLTQKYALELPSKIGMTDSKPARAASVLNPKLSARNRALYGNLTQHRSIVSTL